MYAFALNRTILELKHQIGERNSESVFRSQSHHFGIETRFVAAYRVSPGALNRTILELKPHYHKELVSERLALNRTILELKRAHLLEYQPV